MSHIPPVEAPGFRWSFLEWAIEHPLLVFLDIVIGITFSFVSITVPFPMSLAFVILTVIFLLLIPPLWFYIHHWIKEIKVLSWLALPSGKLTDDPLRDLLLLYPRDATVLIVWIWVGPRVSNWTIRFNAHRDCVVTDISYPPLKTVARDLPGGVFCYSGSRNNDDPVEDFRITLVSKYGINPPKRSVIEIFYKINHSTPPERAEQCKELGMSYLSSMDAWVVGESEGN